MRIQINETSVENDDTFRPESLGNRKMNADLMALFDQNEYPFIWHGILTMF